MQKKDEEIKWKVKLILFATIVLNSETNRSNKLDAT